MKITHLMNVFCTFPLHNFMPKPWDTFFGQGLIKICQFSNLAMIKNLIISFFVFDTINFPQKDL